MQSLEKYRVNKIQCELAKKELELELLSLLETTDEIFLDTYIQRSSLDRQLPIREIVRIINEILIKKEDILTCDSFTVSYKYKMIKCICGVKYSSKLPNCPNKSFH